MLPSHSLPPDSSWIVRQIAALQDQIREGLASVAKSLQPQVDFLLGQTLSAEAAPGVLTTITTNPATASVPDTWVAFDPAADASVTITTSSTGKVLFQAGGYIAVYTTNFAYARGFIGVEILASDGITQVRAPLNGDGNFTSVWDSNSQVINANAGQQHMTTLSPNTTYVIRCRRGYSVGAGNPGSTAQTVFQGTALSVTKIGM